MGHFPPLTPPEVAGLWVTLLTCCVVIFMTGFVRVAREAASDKTRAPPRRRER